MIQTERLSPWTKQESVYSGHILHVYRTGVIFATTSTTPRWLFEKKKKKQLRFKALQQWFNFFLNPEAMFIFSYLSF